MSYTSWTTYGLGICTDDIKEHDVEKLERLLDLAPNFKEKIQKWFDDQVIIKPTWDDYEDFDQDFYCGIATILQGIIKEAEGINLDVCKDCDYGNFLLYLAKFPWDLPEKERNLTTEDVMALFRKYVGRLTDYPVEIDFTTVENGG